MRLLWEGPFFRPLSLDKVNRELTRHLMMKGYEVKILTHTPRSTTSNETNSVWMTQLTGSEMADWHVRHAWPPLFGNRTGPLILMQPWEAGVVPEAWVGAIERDVHKLVVYSQAEVEMYTESGVKQEQIVTIPLGVDLSIYHPWGPRMEIFGARSRVVLWVGGLIPRKGLDLLLSAYGMTIKNTDDITLVVKTVGRDTVYVDKTIPSILQEFLRTDGMPHVIVLDNDLSELEMAALYRRASLVISPYRAEGFNLPVLEAMACGALVVASDTNPTNEFLLPNMGIRIAGQRRYFAVGYSQKNGWSFEPDIESLKESLLRGLNMSDGERQQMTDKSVEHVHQNYAWPTITQHWENLFREESDYPRPRVFPSPAQHIVEWHGPVRNASGYASENRDFIKALPQYGLIPVIEDHSGEDASAVTEKEEMLIRRLERIAVPRGAIAVHGGPVPIAFRRSTGVDLARTFFETDRLPSDWVPRLNDMDGVMVASSFNVKTFTDAGVNPSKLFIVPGTVDTDWYQPGPSVQHEIYNFVSVFDWSYRKGWDILIKAWAKAFHSDDPVRLIIKTTTIVAGSHSDPDSDIEKALNYIGKSRGQCAKITVANDNWTTHQLLNFYRLADVFVLPTRGEGWGRPIFEAMACGVPTIVPNWGAAAEWLNDRNSFPIDVPSLQAVPSNYFIKSYRGHKWARPSEDHLVELLKLCATHRDLVDSKRALARETVLQFHPREATRELVRVLMHFGAKPLGAVQESDR